MAKKRIMLSYENYLKLKSLLVSLRSSQRLKGLHLQHLYDELSSAIVFNHSQVPMKRVLFNSQVEYTNLKDNSRHEAQIVFPADTNSDADKYSILSPIGTALIGEEEGDVTICYAPAGEIPLRIDRVIHH